MLSLLPKSARAQGKVGVTLSHEAASPLSKLSAVSIAHFRAKVFCLAPSIMAAGPQAKAVGVDDVRAAHDSGERDVRALVLGCGSKGTFKGEVYQFRRPILARDGRSNPGCFFWIFRWMVDYLGGSPTRNLSGKSREAIAGRTGAVLADGLSSSEDEAIVEVDEKEDDVPVPCVDEHMTASSMMTRQRQVAKRKKSTEEQKQEVKGEIKAEAKDEPSDSSDSEGLLRRADFSLSSFACLCWLAQLMSKGTRANAKWHLGSAEIQARAEALLCGMRDCFWQDVRKGCFVVVEGQLSVEPLASKMGSLAAKVFGKQKMVPVVEALKTLQADAARRSLSGDRRRLAEKIFSRLVRSLAEAIEDSAGKSIWTANRVESLDQLRNPWAINVFGLIIIPKTTTL